MLKEASRPGWAHAYTDWRGVITGASLEIGEPGSSDRQILELYNGKQGTTAVLRTRGPSMTHEVAVAVAEDGHVYAEDSLETLRLDTPWLAPGFERKTTGITALDDPRLERVAEAAQLGFLLVPGELGEGWSFKNEGARQTWSTWGQEIVLDSAARNFRVHTQASFLRRDDEVQEVHSRLLWQDGRITDLDRQT